MSTSAQITPEKLVKLLTLTAVARNTANDMHIIFSQLLHSHDKVTCKCEICAEVQKNLGPAVKLLGEAIQALDDHVKSA